MPPAEHSLPHAETTAWIPHSFLVTGAAGFIGSQLAVRLAELHGGEAVTALVPPFLETREAERLDNLKALGVRILTCDLLKLERERPEIPRFDAVYHLAGYAITEDPSGPFEVNSRGTRLLLEWLGTALSGKRVIHVGTLASVDSRLCRGGVDENTSCVPTTIYGSTKLEGEKHVAGYSGRFGFHYSILRLCTIVGKGCRPGGMFGVFPELLQKEAVSVRLNWPGKASFLGVDDLVRILVEFGTLDHASGEIYVTGNGEQPTFDELLETMAHTLGIRRRRIELPAAVWNLILRLAWLGATFPFVPAQARIFFWRVSHLCGDGLLANVAKLNKRIHFPFKSLEQALRETYEQPNRKTLPTAAGKA